MWYIKRLSDSLPFFFLSNIWWMCCSWKERLELGRVQPGRTTPTLLQLCHAPPSCSVAPRYTHSSDLPLLLPCSPLLSHHGPWPPICRSTSVLFELPAAISVPSFQLFALGPAWLGQHISVLISGVSHYSSPRAQYAFAHVHEPTRLSLLIQLWILPHRVLLHIP